MYLGKAKKYFTNLQVAEFDLESFSLKKGDNILITGKTTGVVQTIVGEMRLNDNLVKNVRKGDNFSMKLDYTVRPRDKLYKIVNSE
jgi:putative protease